MDYLLKKSDFLIGFPIINFDNHFYEKHSFYILINYKNKID